MSNTLRSDYDALKNDFRSTIKGSSSQMQRNQEEAERQYREQLAALGQQLKQTEHERKMRHQMLARQHQQQKQLMLQKHRELLRLKQQLKGIAQHEQVQNQKEAQLIKRRARLNEIADDFDSRHERIVAERQRLDEQKQKIMNYMANFDELSQNPANVPTDFEMPQMPMNEMDEMNAPQDYGMKPPMPAFGVSNVMNYDEAYYSPPEVNRNSHRWQMRRSRNVLPEYDVPRRQTRHKHKRARPRRDDRGRSKSRRRRKTRKRQRENANPKSGNLYVRLANAHGIFGHRGTKPNTYVEMECDGNRQVSSTKKHTSDPEWNEFFKFRVRNFEKSTLGIRLIDARSGKSITKMKVGVRDFVDKINTNNQPKSYEMGNKVNMDLDIHYQRGGDGIVTDVLKNQ